MRLKQKCAQKPLSKPSWLHRKANFFIWFNSVFLTFLYFSVLRKFYVGLFVKRWLPRQYLPWKLLREGEKAPFWQEQRGCVTFKKRPKRRKHFTNQQCYFGYDSIEEAIYHITKDDNANNKKTHPTDNP